MAGVRIHFDAIDSSMPFHKVQHLFWKIELVDGQTVMGKLMYETKDAITLKTTNGNETWTTAQIKSKTPMSREEVKIELKSAIFLEPEETAWFSWRKEDSLFHTGPFSGITLSKGSQSGILQGAVSSMIEKMPSGSIDEKTKTKVLQAYRSGKLDMNTIQAKMKTMDPKVIEEYQKKMQGG